MKRRLWSFDNRRSLSAMRTLVIMGAIMVALVKHDLEFILRQIEIAEAHAQGGVLAELVAGYNGNDGLTQAHLLPYGLRTVDGSYNNLLPGR
ncbi:hypothetical protein, partial [Methylorubrum extorquens]|uniref:hypothetical protein n=1 Tax=Methylorubrum extorquens TaxID=408 RepID=UPI0011BDBE82